MSLGLFLFQMCLRLSLPLTVFVIITPFVLQNLFGSFGAPQPFGRKVPRPADIEQFFIRFVFQPLVLLFISLIGCTRIIPDSIITAFPKTLFRLTLLTLQFRDPLSFCFCFLFFLLCTVVPTAAVPINASAIHNPFFLSLIKNISFLKSVYVSIVSQPDSTI